MNFEKLCIYIEEPTTLWYENNQLSIDTKKLNSKKKEKQQIRQSTTQHFFFFFFVLYIFTVSYICGWSNNID